MAIREKKHRIINIGVVGLGRIGWDFHCKEIKKNKKYKLVAVSDVSKERCMEAEATYSCASYIDYSAFLKHPDLDVIVIATPTHMHKAMAIEALVSGKHVILEKPMASNAKEAKAIIEVAKKYKKVLTVFQPARLGADFQQVKSILNSGLIGDIYQIKINRYKFQRRDDWQSIKKYGGGMLANYGSHVIGQLLELMGSDKKKLFCALRCVATLGDADDVAKVVLLNKKGVLGEVDINSATIARASYFEIFGTLGFLSLRGNMIEVRYFNKKELATKKLKRTLTPEDRKYPSDNFNVKEKSFEVSQKHEIDLFDNFYEHIVNKKPLAVLPEEVLDLVKVIDSCKKNAGKELQTRI